MTKKKKKNIAEYITAYTKNHIFIILGLDFLSLAKRNSACIDLFMQLYIRCLQEIFRTVIMFMYWTWCLYSRCICVRSSVIVILPQMWHTACEMPHVLFAALNAKRSAICAANLSSYVAFPLGFMIVSNKKFLCVIISIVM